MSYPAFAPGRVCTTCDTWKDESHFGLHAGYAGGLRSTCAECRRVQTPRAARNAELRSLLAQGEYRCVRCDEVKPVAEFTKNAARRHGFTNVCKACNPAVCRAGHEKHYEKRTAAQAAYYERRKVEDPEAIRANGRAARQRRRALLRGAFVENVDPRVVFERDEGVCGICGKPVERGRFDIDHVVPLALGGVHGYDNVRISHVSCNRRRGRSVALTDDEQTKGGNELCL